MKRDYTVHPETNFSARARMKKFVDCLNKAGIFNEKIPYLVIHQGEKYYSSKLELKLTFKENIKDIFIDKNCDELNEQFEKYIIDKLNDIPNFVFKKSTNKVFLEIIDKTNSEHYKKYVVAYNFEIFNEFHKENSNNCTLIIRIYNKDIPLFEIL